MAQPDHPHLPLIETLRVQNYRALRKLELKNLTPLTAFIGPNGGGKSTVFDVFAFLAECFEDGLVKAWDRRGRFQHLRTRGSRGPIVIEIKYRERRDTTLITYHLEIDEEDHRPIVAREWLQWKRGSHSTGRPYKFVDFTAGSGRVISGEDTGNGDPRIEESLDSPDLLAVSTFGQLTRHPRVSGLRRFITSWYLSYLSASAARGVTEAGTQERLSASGDNLANVIEYLEQQHPDRLQEILRVLASRVPRLEQVSAGRMPDGRLLLQFKDGPFDEPVLARYVSDGTLKMLAYLIVLYDPEPPQLIGIEEPENYLHPKLLIDLVEECRRATERTQVLVTTHSPWFVNGLRPDEVWVIYRNPEGYTEAQRASSMKAIRAHTEAGGLLGSLWMEGYFEVGDPRALVGA